jgi:hypothetical protein
MALAQQPFWRCSCSQVLARACQGVALQPILMHMLSCILFDYVSMRQNAGSFKSTISDHAV